MKSFVTTTNITNGTIITITRLQKTPINYPLIFLGVVGLLCLASGIYLMFQKKSPTAAAGEKPAAKNT